MYPMMSGWGFHLLAASPEPLQSYEGYDEEKKVRTFTTL